MRSKHVTYKQNSTFSCILTSVFVPAFTDVWAHLLLVQVNLHFLTGLKTNETTCDTETEKIRITRIQTIQLDYQQGHFRAVTWHIYCLKNSEHVLIRWEEVQYSRCALVHQILKKKKKTCVRSSFRKHMDKTHKTITTATKIHMECSQFALQTTFSLCYRRQVLLGRKCGALISPEADSTGSPPGSVWSRSCCLPLQHL